MKTVVYCAVCIIATYSVMAIWENCFSDEDEVQRIVEAGKGLNHPHRAGQLVSIVWYKGFRRIPHKVFATQREMEDIQTRLEYKTSKSEMNNETLDFSQEDMLSFVYYSNKKDDFQMRYIPFKIEDGIFYWPYGEDKRLAQILINKEIWDQSFFQISQRAQKYEDDKKEIRKKLGIDDKYKMIGQITMTLIEKGQKSQREIELLDTCKKAKRNLLDLVGYYTSEVTLKDILLELNKGELSESLVHAFVELPKPIIEKYSKSIKPEYIMRVEHFNIKYAEEGLDRKEQIELFQVRQKINKQILDELQRRQDDFERLLKTNEFNQ